MQRFIFCSLSPLLFVKITNKVYTLPMDGFYITSQVFAFFALICVVLAYQQKDKKKVLFLIAITNLFMVVSWAFLQNWITVAIVALVVVRLLLFNFLETRYKKIHWSFLVLFLAVTGIVSWLTYQNAYDILVIVAGVAFTYANWQKSVVVLKIFAVVCGALIIAYCAIQANYVAMALDSLAIISIGVSYVKHLLNKKNKEISNEKI